MKSHYLITPPSKGVDITITIITTAVNITKA